MKFPPHPSCVPADHAQSCEREIADFCERHGDADRVEWIDIPDGIALTAHIAGRIAVIGVSEELLLRAAP